MAGPANISSLNHLLGKVTVGAPTAGGTNRAATTGTPDVVILGRIFDVTTKASGASDAKDSVTQKASPVLKTGENMVVVHTLGFTDGTASAAPAIEYHTLFSGKGTTEIPAELPVHVDHRHCPYAVEMWQNNGSSDFQYGVTNFAASSASGVKYESYSVAHQAVRADWNQLLGGG